MRATLPPLRDESQEDLYQECFMKACDGLVGYRGTAKLETWALGVARNHLVSKSRSIGSRPKVNFVDFERMTGIAGSGEPSYEPDLGQRLVLRSQTKQLLGWLADRPDGIEQGWAVLNLLLKTHGNWDYTARALCLHTGRAWTTERVRNVVRAIKETPMGLALCDSLGLSINEGVS